MKASTRTRQSIHLLGAIVFLQRSSCGCTNLLERVAGGAVQYFSLQLRAQRDEYGHAVSERSKMGERSVVGIRKMGKSTARRIIFLAVHTVVQNAKQLTPV